MKRKHTKLGSFVMILALVLSFMNPILGTMRTVSAQTGTPVGDGATSAGNLEKEYWKDKGGRAPREVADLVKFTGKVEAHRGLTPEDRLSTTSFQRFSYNFRIDAGDNIIDGDTLTIYAENFRMEALENLGQQGIMVNGLKIAEVEAKFLEDMEGFSPNPLIYKEAQEGGSYKVVYTLRFNKNVERFQSWWWEMDVVQETAAITAMKNASTLKSAMYLNSKKISETTWYVTQMNAKLGTTSAIFGIGAHGAGEVVLDGLVNDTEMYYAAVIYPNNYRVRKGDYIDIKIKPGASFKFNDYMLNSLATDKTWLTTVDNRNMFNNPLSKINPQGVVFNPGEHITWRYERINQDTIRFHVDKDYPLLYSRINTPRVPIKITDVASLERDPDTGRIINLTNAFVRYDYHGAKNYGRDGDTFAISDISYGGGAPYVTDADYVNEEPLPFERVRRLNRELEPGTEVLIQTGLEGLKQYYYKGNTLVKEVTLYQPVDEIIEYNDLVVKEWKEPIPYMVYRTFNPELPPGTEMVIQEGHTGEVLIRTEDGVEVLRKVLEKAQDKIIEYNDTVVDEHTEPIPFDIIRRYNPDLAPGSEKVVQVGEMGEEYVRTENGEEVERKVLKEPIDLIIEYNDKEIEIVKIPVPFETIRVFDETIPPGTEVVVQKGFPGEDEVTYENGEEVKRERTKDPILEVIKYNDTDQNLDREPIPYETIRRHNPELKPGTERVVQKGETGELTRRYENGKLVSETITKHPVDEIIEYNGESESEIPYETIYRHNPDLTPGERRVVQPGEPGLIKNGKVVKEPVDEIVEFNDLPNGDIPYQTIRRHNPNLKPGTEVVVQKGEMGHFQGSKITKQPVDEIIEYNDHSAPGADQNEIPFQTIRRQNPNLTPGSERVVQEGEPGLKKITLDENGNVVSEEIVKQPVDKIVEYNDATAAAPVGPGDQQPPQEPQKTQFVEPEKTQFAEPQKQQHAQPVTLQTAVDRYLVPVAIVMGVAAAGMVTLYIIRKRKEDEEQLTDQQ